MSNSNSRHTPGPWKAERHKNKQFPTCLEIEIWNQNTHITTIHEHVENVKIDLANARLIAAAPELLEALEQAKVRLECAGLNDTTLDIIKQAIAKAKGGAE